MSRRKLREKERKKDIVYKLSIYNQMYRNYKLMR